MLFHGWDDLGRVLVGVLVAYPLLVLILRVSGKRTLATMNAFDLVVTVALGSTLATTLLNSQVALAEGVLALGLLALAQFVVAWTTVRVRTVRSLAKSTPALLVRDGAMQHEVMKRERVTAGEVRQALRSQGIGSVEQVAAVVLETDGSFSVVPRSSAGSGSALTDAFPRDDAQATP